MAKKEGLAILLGLGKPKVKEEDESDTEMSDEDVDVEGAKKDAAQEVLDAIEGKDAEKLSDAFSTFVDLCMHCHDEEGEEPEEDSDEDEG